MGIEEFAYRNHVEGKTVTIYAYKPTPIRLFNMEIPFTAALRLR